MNNNLREAKRWLQQAKYDLKVAEHNINGRFYSWSCFTSQQAAEKALKAFLHHQGKRRIVTHSVYDLLKQCAVLDGKFKRIFMTKELDMYYLPTRYPNATESEVPHEYYTRRDAEKCVRYARMVLELVERILKV